VARRAAEIRVRNSNTTISYINRWVILLLSKCPNCGKERPPSDYLFPLENRVEVPYCRCIKWESLYGCIRLSALNAERLLKDADLLLRTAGPEVYYWWVNLQSRIDSNPESDLPHLDDKETTQLASKVDYPRLITALSLLVLAVQEVGKAALAIEQLGKKKDLDFKGDYQKRFVNHRAREQAAASLMKKLKLWPPGLEKRSKNLEVLRQASLYVDYDFNFGIWLDPSALGSPEESGSMYSGALLTGFVELLLGRDWRDPEGQTDTMLGGERFNTFSFAILLKSSLTPTIKVVKEYVEELTKNAKVKRSIGRSIRFAQYLRTPKGLSRKQEVEEMARRLNNITKLLSPMIAGKVDRETREHFGLESPK
jgi:AbiV family abortive infection protein